MQQCSFKKNIAEQMPLPLTISCSSKSRLVLPFWYQLTRVVPDKIQKSCKMIVCVCFFPALARKMLNCHLKW